MNFLLVLMTGFFAHAAPPPAQPATVNVETTKKEVVYNKTPKSLFLIKKARVDSEVGEPTLNVENRQYHTLSSDERIKHFYD
jgi:hypothetical protein